MLKNKYLKLLTPAQRKVVFKSVFIFDLVILMIIVLLSLKLLGIGNYLVNSQTDQAILPGATPISWEQFRQKFHNQIDASFELLNHWPIDLRSNTMPIEFSLALTYPVGALGSDSEPMFKLNDGEITHSFIEYHRVIDGKVYELRVYDGYVDIYYRQNLYPLDKQRIKIDITPIHDNSSHSDNYYLNILDFGVSPSMPLYYHDYLREKHGFYSQPLMHQKIIGDRSIQFYTVENQVYLDYSHKNIYAYLKNMQYTLLSLITAIFALLINSRVNNPSTGRISAISGSMFALAANLFHVSTLIRPIGGIGLIDLVTTYAGSIIIIALLITVKSVQFNEEYGFDTSKAHDILLFKHLFALTTFFFIEIYCLI